MPTVLDVARFIWLHPANRRHRLQTLCRSVAWQIYKRATGCYWDLQVFDGLRLRCYPDSPSASLVIYCSSLPDYHEMGFMRRYLRQGDAFIDGGANIGVYALLAASLVTSHGRVDAFEPAPKALARLRENVAINALTQVFVHPVALGASAGLVSFLRDCDTTNRIRTDADVEAVVVDVPCARLDEVVGGRRYAMGKLDLEGAELLALQGAERMLASANPPVWLLELNGSLHAYGLREAQFADWLRCRGYDLALYDADHGELRFEPEPWSEMANVLAVARAVRNEVLEKLSARA